MNGEINREMLVYECARGRVEVCTAWDTASVLAAIEAGLARWEHRLPADRDSRIVIKPNLNNDLQALTGNCTDLRVLEGLLGGLRRRGYRDITVADGSNVGVARRGIDSFSRLKVRELCQRHDDVRAVRVVDLNTDAGREIPLKAGGLPRVAATVLESDFLISVPKIKTHAEAGLSCAMKNWPLPMAATSSRVFSSNNCCPTGVKVPRRGSGMTCTPGVPKAME